MNKTVIFYAPIGKEIDSSRIGGAERGALRALELLRENGFKVFQIDKPYIENGKKKFLMSVFKAIREVKKLIRKYPEAVVYIAGFYEKNIFFEKHLISYAKHYGNKIIYEPKNGRFVKAYLDGGRRYQYNVDKIISKSDFIFCQGLSYVRFIKDAYPQKAIYMPNYVLDRLKEPVNTNRSSNVLKVIYFGRVTSAKGVDVALKTVADLVEKGFPIEMTIIGGYTDEYKKELDNIIENLGLINTVSFTGSKPFEEIREYLQKSHYFIFPSNEPDEGHSNALTEAMTFGVVPLASNIGFNKDIISDEQLIVESFESIDYANCIELIEQKNMWREKSNKMVNRAEENYSEKIVKNNFLTIFENLIGKYQ